MRAILPPSVTAAFALIAVIALPTRAAETTLPRRDELGQFSVTIGAEYSSGNYGGSADTDIWYFPLIFRYERDRWLYRVEVPYLIVQGPSDVLIVSGGGMGGHGPGGSMTATSTSRTDSGIGDIVGAVSYKLQRGAASHPAVDLTGMVYFGTADAARNLGTGENDYAAQLDVAQDASVATVFGTLGYRVTGDPPGIDYNDVFYGTFGIEHAFVRNIAGVALDARQTYLSGVDAFATLTGYLITRPNTSTKLTAYLLLGLSDAAPDWGVGVTYGWYY
ncbi:MAG TPA: hypothetical protein VN277_07450 [Acidiferrobacterales bacterium]|nr:hypothetical protein [Acidiferrobacterales bacterium]